MTSPNQNKLKKRLRSDKRDVLVNGLVNWCGFAAQVVITFITAPILIRMLGDTRYGIWSLVESMLAYLTLFDLGLTASVVRFTSKFEATDDKESRDRALSTSFALFMGVGLLALLASLLLSIIGPRMFSIPEEMAHEGQWLFILLGVNLAVGLPMNVFPSILAGLGRYPSNTIIRTVCLIIRSSLMVVAVIRGGGLIELALVITGTSFLEYLLLALAVRFHLPDFRFSPSLVSSESFRMIMGYSIDAFIIAVNNRISFRTDPMVISFFLGPQAITPYVVAQKLVSYATSSVRAFTQVLTPAVSAWEAKGNIDAIRGVMINGTRYVLWIIAPMEIGLLVLGKPFLTLWIGPRLADLSYPTLAVLSLPLVLSLSQSISTRILFGTDGLRWLSRVGLISSAVNIALSIILVVPLGILGVAIGTAIPYSIYNIAVEKHVCHRMGIGMRRFLTEAYAKPMMVAPVLGIVWLIAVWTLPMNWWTMVGITGCGLALYLAAALVLEFGPNRVNQWLVRPFHKTMLKTAPSIAERDK